jgi:Arc/MetJ family transcription regulator
MRTTIDLDDELHAETLEEARRSRRSLSAVVNDALRRSLRPVAPVELDEVTGLGVVRLGYPVTADDVDDVLDD